MINFTPRGTIEVLLNEDGTISEEDSDQIVLIMLKGAGHIPESISSLSELDDWSGEEEEE